MTLVIIAVPVLIFIVFLIKQIASRSESLDDDMVDYSKPSLSKSFQTEALAKCMIENATCAKLKYTDFRGDVYDVKYDGKNVHIEKETEKDDMLKEYYSEKSYIQGGFRLIESSVTRERINNFNKNMKHIKLWDSKDERYKPVIFCQGITDFFDVDSLSELCDYLCRKLPTGGNILDKLIRIGFGKKNAPTKIIYDYGDGREKIIKENGTIVFEELFDRWEM